MSTHFHPEHALGEAAFPSSAKIIRAQAQQKDIDEFGLALARTSASCSPLFGRSRSRRTSSFARPTSSSTFVLHARPGGVRSMLSLGPTATRGDTIVWVEGDRSSLPATSMNRRSSRSPVLTERGFGLSTPDRTGAAPPREGCPEPRPHGRRFAHRRAADDDEGDSVARDRARAAGEIGGRHRANRPDGVPRRIRIGRLENAWAPSPDPLTRRRGQSAPAPLITSACATARSRWRTWFWRHCVSPRGGGFRVRLVGVPADRRRDSGSSTHRARRGCRPRSGFVRGLAALCGNQSGEELVGERLIRPAPLKGMLKR